MIDFDHTNKALKCAWINRFTNTVKNIVSLLWKHDFKIIKYFLTQSAIKIKNC